MIIACAVYTRGKKYVLNDLTLWRVKSMTAKGTIQPTVAIVLGIEEKCLRCGITVKSLMAMLPGRT